MLLSTVFPSKSLQYDIPKKAGIGRRATVLFILVFAALAVPGYATAQDPLTGTRLKSAGSANPRTVIRLQQPDEVADIERLLLRGDMDSALEMALGFVAQVDAGMDGQSRYFAHNALCVVYTKIGENTLAEEHCDIAIEVMPGHWSAWNNRATLYYLAGDFAAAQADYRRALEQAPGRDSIRDMLRHNLSLAEINLIPREQSETADSNRNQ